MRGAAKGGEQTQTLRPEADVPSPTQPSRPGRRRRFSKAAVRQLSCNFGSGWKADLDIILAQLVPGLSAHVDQRRSVMSPMKPEDCDLLIFEYMRQKNLQAVVELFEADATFVLGDGSVVQGHDAIREAVKGWIDAEKLEWTYGPIAYQDKSGSIALLRGTWSATFRDEAGKISTSTGKNVEIVRRQPDGTWRFVIDHAKGAD